MKNRLSTALAIAGISLGVGIAINTQPANRPQAASFYQISARNTASYVVQLKQSSRNDGLFAFGPYRTSATTQKPDTSARNYNNQYATAVAEATTATGKWIKIQLTNGKQYWIDALGVQKVGTYKVTAQVNTNQLALLKQSNRNDGLFLNGPYRTSATTMKPNANAKAYNGQYATITATATTASGKWDKLTLANGKQYWVDASGVQTVALYTITNRTTATGLATLNQSKRNDGLFANGPYRTSATTMKPNASAKAYNNQGVAILAKATTATGNWLQIRLTNGKIYWIDAKGVATTNQNQITNQVSVQKTAVISQAHRNDGLFVGGPYKTSPTSIKPAAFAKSKNGTGVYVIATATAGGTNWAEIRLGNATYWIDARGISYFTLSPITSQASANSRAIVSQSKRSDGLFANGPYHSSLATLKPITSAKSLNGQVVEVNAHATTALGNWSRIKTGTGKFYWIDTKGLMATSYYMISNKKSLNKTAQISQSGRHDGLFASGPYKTSSKTTKATASARKYNGQTVKVIASASTETGNWVQVKFSNGKTYWLDARGVKYTIFHDWTKPSQSYAYPNVSNYAGINIEVNLSKQEVYIKRNNTVLYTMYCSSGKNGATPTGHYQIQAERGSAFWEGNIGARWYTSWKGHGIYLFHSVLIDRNYHYIPSESKWLGIKPISHGCIRMSGPDAKWINEHMKVGTKLYIHN